MRQLFKIFLKNCLNFSVVGAKPNYLVGPSVVIFSPAVADHIPRLQPRPFVSGSTCMRFMNSYTAVAGQPTARPPRRNLTDFGSSPFRTSVYMYLRDRKPVMAKTSAILIMRIASSDDVSSGESLGARLDIIQH